jgi:hypothetical protein
MVGPCSDFVLARDTSDNVVEHLAAMLCRDAVLCSDSGTVMMAAAQKLGIEHRAINLASYLGWFRALDRLQDAVSNPASFLALAIGH